MNKLLLIDGYAVLHRAFHALPPMRNKDGEMTNAIYGFVSMLIKLITEISPTHIVITFDRHEKTLRRQKFEAYQGKRADVDESLSVQFGFAREMASALKIPSYELAGYESDDLIGTISQNLKSNKNIDQVIIVTGDRDILQLINEKTKVYMPILGLSNGKLFGENETIERMGVPPSQIVEYKSLVGDASDNYPGVPGIGPKTAIALIKDYRTLDNIYKNLDKIAPKTQAKLVQNKESAYLSHELAKIYTDVEIDFKIEDSSKWDIDGESALSFYEKMGFKTLVERVKKLGKKLDEDRQSSLF